MDVNFIQPWTDYWTGKPLLFPTTGSARQFIDLNKKKLEDEGLLINSSRGFLVDAKALDERLIELIQRPLDSRKGVGPKARGVQS